MLDSENDVLLSRAVEQREMEDWHARRLQQRRAGRVRADPVVVRPRLDRELYDAPMETNGGRQSSDPAASREVSHMNRPETNGDGSIQSDSTPRPKLQRTPSSDNESSTSSDSSAGIEIKPARSSFNLLGKANGRKKKAEKHSEPPTADAPLRKGKGKKKAEKHSEPLITDASLHKGKGKLPRLKVKGGHLSLQMPKSSQKPRARRYSFEKGDDETLSVTSPTWDSEPYAHPKSPQHEAVRLRNGVRPRNSSDSVATAILTSGPGSGLMRHSSSSNTIRWVGNGSVNGNGSGNVNGNGGGNCSPRAGDTGHRQVDDSG